MEGGEEEDGRGLLNLKGLSLNRTHGYGPKLPAPCPVPAQIKAFWAKLCRSQRTPEVALITDVAMGRREASLAPVAAGRD